MTIQNLRETLLAAPRVFVECRNEDIKDSGYGWELGKCLFSPIKAQKSGNQDWELMLELRRGHAIIHILKSQSKHGRIVGVSLVRSQAKEENDTNYRVKLKEYTPINEISLDEFLDKHGTRIRQEIDGNDLKSYPFGRHGNNGVALWQRYLTEATKRLVKLILPALKPVPEKTKQDEESDDKSKSGRLPTIGNLPSVGGYGVIREKKPAYLYAIRFEDTEIFKIGWAFDVKSRLEDINKHIPHEFLKMRWKRCLTNRFRDQFAAYEAEQSFLEFLKPSRTIGERVKLKPSRLRTLWRDFISSHCS